MDIKRIGLRIMSIMKLDQEWFAFAYTCYSRCIGWLKHDDWTFLRGVSFELMEPCNRKCSYCPVSSMPPRAGKMSEELFDKVIDAGFVVNPVLAVTRAEGHADRHLHVALLIPAAYISSASLRLQIEIDNVWHDSRVL